MTKKELMQKALQELPDDADYDEAIDRLLYLQGVERGLADADAGRLTNHEELLKQIKTWRK